MELNALSVTGEAMQLQSKTRAKNTPKVHDPARPKNSTGCSYADVYARYPQGVFVADNDRETARTLTRTITSSLSSFQPIIPFNEDVRLFNAAVQSVVEAVRDRVLTEDEGNAVIEAISRSLTNRRVEAAFMQLAALPIPMIASFDAK